MNENENKKIWGIINCKIIILLSLMFFCLNSLFGQNIWTTVRNNEIRVISLSSVKSEVLNIWDSFSWCYFDWEKESTYITRERYHQRILFLYDGNISSASRAEGNQIINWLNNNQRFVYATTVVGLGTQVTFVLDDDVIIITFSNMNPRNLAFTTRNRESRRWLEELIDDIL